MRSTCSLTKLCTIIRVHTLCSYRQAKFMWCACNNDRWSWRTRETLMQATSCSHPNLSLAHSSPSLHLVASYSLEDCRPFRLILTYNAGVGSAYGEIGEGEWERKEGREEGGRVGQRKRKGKENDKKGGYVSCALFSAWSYVHAYQRQCCMFSFFTAKEWIYTVKHSVLYRYHFAPQCWESLVKSSSGQSLGLLLP